jgi:hypothetical protein
LGCFESAETVDGRSGVASIPFEAFEDASTACGSDVWLHPASAMAERISKTDRTRTSLRLLGSVRVAGEVSMSYAAVTPHALHVSVC